MRTSVTHPLQIAYISAGAGMGKVGVTFCPGKKQQFAVTGAWDRDLAAEIAAIAQWNAAAVVTLIEHHELDSLGVQGLGEAVRAGHMAWDHLPIADVSTPGRAFEEAWVDAGAELRAIMRAGFNVLVHCTVEQLWKVIGDSLDAFTPTECANYFAAEGYDAY
jgi:ADP-ribosyl-[dinitrogen reductase] hydrolase